MSDYVELIRDAKDALGDLLRATEPGTGADLHRTYASLKDMLAQRHGTPEREEMLTKEREQHERDRIAELERQREREARSWSRLPQQAREHQVIEALGDDRLSVTSEGPVSHPEAD